jgi:arginine repressor
MKIHNLVKELLSQGYTQKTLAQELTDRGCETTQPTIFRICSNPNYQTGADRALAIFMLYEEQKQ